MVEQMLNTIAFPLDDTLYLANAEQAFLSSRGNGIYSEEGELIVNANNNMTVTISPGRAWLHPSKFQGLVFINFEPQTLEVALPDGFNKRIDRVVIQYDVPNNVVNLKIKQGVPSTNPKPPSLERDEFIAYELGIAEIHLDKGSTFISNSMIKDTRLDESVCGIMRDNVTRIPTQQLYNQFHDWYNTHTEQWKKDFTLWYTTNTTKWVEDFTNWYTTNTNQWENDFQTWVSAWISWYTTNTEKWTQDFQTWFDGIKGQLSGDVATNLANQVMELKNKTVALENEVNTFKLQTNESINTINGNVSTLNTKVDTLESKVGSTVADKATQDLIKEDTTQILTNSTQTLDKSTQTIDKVTDIQNKTNTIQTIVKNIQPRTNEIHSIVNQLKNNPTTGYNFPHSGNILKSNRKSTATPGNVFTINGAGIIYNFKIDVPQYTTLTITVDDVVTTFENIDSGGSPTIEFINSETFLSKDAKNFFFATLKKTYHTDTYSRFTSPLYLLNGIGFKKNFKIDVTVNFKGNVAGLLELYYSLL